MTSSSPIVPQFYTVLGAVVLLSMTAHSLEAPGDESSVCQTGVFATRSNYGRNIKVLMDSNNYENLLGNGAEGVWRERDYDSNNVDTVYPQTHVS